MRNYYNEIDPFASEWLRELIKAKVIPDGEVDSRSIVDIIPSDLKRFTQCHFFAGIGGWSEALRLARWNPERPVWTGSCPCQSFSTAGKGNGFDDERHLWPAWFHLIEQCKPSVVFGEQVDAAIKFGWLDLVQTDFQGIGHSFSSTTLPAASVGAPHGRHRVFYVAESKSEQYDRSGIARYGRFEPSKCSTTSELEFTNLPDSNERTSSGQQSIHQVGDGQSITLVNTESEQARVSRFARERRKTAGFWLDADWIPCSDGKWRPIEPGVFPLAHGVRCRIDKLRGFGNAIVPQVAATFVEAYMTS